MPVKRWWRSERISCTRDKSLTRQKRSPMRSFNLSALAVQERAITLFFIFAAACAGTRWQAQRRTAGKLKPERKFNMKNNGSSSLEDGEQGYKTMDRGLGRLTAMAVGVCLSRGEFTPKGSSQKLTTHPTLSGNVKFMNFYPFSDIETISPRPMLFITGETAHSREFSEEAYKLAAEPKELLIVPGAGHVDLYDRVELIPLDKLASF